MAKRKPREPKSTSQFSWFHLKISFYFLFVTLFLLFYPGNSKYVEIFAFNRSLFDTAAKESRQFNVQDFPIVKDPTPQPFITAQSAYVIDTATATPVYEKNPDQKLLPASTVKVVTALTARDFFELDDILEVKRVVDIGQSADLIQDERLTFESLLYAMLIHSGNDAAYVVADNHPGGYDAFIQAMNSKARSLGMENSQFENPAGLDDFEQVTTVKDLTLAGRELLKDKELAKIVSTKSITISDVDFQNFHALYNINRLLGETPGVGGIKTGKTEEAGENLITLYRYNGHEFLIALMKSEDRFLDTQALVDWIQINVEFVEVEN